MIISKKILFLTNLIDQPQKIIVAEDGSLFFIFSEILRQQMIELTLVYYIDGEGSILFDYDTEPAYQKYQFRKQVFSLIIPDGHVYYHIHWNTKKTQQDCYDFYLQKSSTPISELRESLRGVLRYKIVTSIKLTRQTNNQGESVVHVESLPATAIKRIAFCGNFEETEMNHPQAVVRSFIGGYPLRSQQILRLGETEFKIIEVSTNLDRIMDYRPYQPYLLNLDLNPKTFDKAQDWICRMCFVDQKNQVQNIMVSPCKCTQISSVAHIKCLRNFIKQTLQEIRIGSFYQTDLLYCPICIQKYPIGIIKNEKIYGLLPFFQGKRRYISLVPNDNKGNLSFISFQDTQEVSIGRSVQNGLVLEDKSVSLKHAKIQYEGGRMVVKDEMSKFGTLIREEGMRTQLGNEHKAFQVSNMVLNLQITQ